MASSTLSVGCRVSGRKRRMHTTIMEKQIEKELEQEMESRVTWGLYRDIQGNGTSGGFYFYRI